MAVGELIGRLACIRGSQLFGLVLTAERLRAGRGPKRRRYVAELLLGDGTIRKFVGKKLRFTPRAIGATSR